jgi:Na+/H+-dicarboxylate symporter
MSPPVRILVGLGLGLACGFGLAAAGVHGDDIIVTSADTIGGLWIAALRMTILPLVFALIVTGVAARVEAAGSAGRITRLSFAIFITILLCAILIVAMVVPLLLSLWPTPPQSAAAIRHAVLSGAKLPPLPGVGEMLRGFIPINVFSAAAADNMIPVVFFALVFGFAVANGPGERRAGLGTYFEWIRETMLVIVGWVILLAPLGVFMLALKLGAKTGFAAIGALAHYVVVVVAMAVLAVAFAYALASLVGKVGLARFSRAAAPAQSIALSTRSSIATLPAMISACEVQLCLPTRITSVTLPLAVSLFRICGPMTTFTVGIYCAYLLGVPLAPTQLVVGGLVAILMLATGGGIPAEVTFFAAYVPIFNAMGIPIEILALLVAVEAIPDMFRTVANVTMDMAATSIAARLASRAVTEHSPSLVAGE